MRTTSLLTALLLVASCTKSETGSGESPGREDNSVAAEKDTKVAAEKATKVEDEKPGDDRPSNAAASSGRPIELPAQLSAAGFPGSLMLIPEQAEFIVGVSLGSIMASPIYALASGELAQDQEFQAALALLRDCGLDPAKFESIVVGFNQRQDLAAVLVGDGIGEDQNASCVIASVQKKAGRPQTADVITQDGKKVVQFTAGRAFLVDDRTLALATTSWASSVVDLLDGKGTPAALAKQELLVKVDGRATVWGLGPVPAEVVRMAPLLGLPAELKTVRDVVASLELGEGATIRMVAGFASEDIATMVASKLRSLLGDARKIVAADLAGVVKNTQVETDGADVKIVVTATAAEIAKAAKEI